MEIADAIYQDLQGLHVQTTEHNVMLLADCFLQLRELQRPKEAPQVEVLRTEGEDDARESAE